MSINSICFVQQIACHTNGINLTLPSHRDIPGANWTWDWFKGGSDAKIVGLQMDVQYTNYIVDQPFQFGVFLNVKFLRLDNLRTTELPKWMFNGLYRLEVLTITNATIRSYSNGILEYFKDPDSLQSFTLIERDENEVNNIVISSFIGGNSANMLRQFQRENYLRNFIYATFSNYIAATISK